MTLDRFELAGIPAAPRGEARVEVTFDINVNGILHVSAHDLPSGNSHQLRISPRLQMRLCSHRLEALGRPLRQSGLQR